MQLRQAALASVRRLHMSNGEQHAQEREAEVARRLQIQAGVTFFSEWRNTWAELNPDTPPDLGEFERDQEFVRKFADASVRADIIKAVRGKLEGEERLRQAPKIEKPALPIAGGSGEGPPKKARKERLPKEKKLKDEDVAAKFLKEGKKADALAAYKRAFEKQKSETSAKAIVRLSVELEGAEAAQRFIREVRISNHDLASKLTIQLVGLEGVPAAAPTPPAPPEAEAETGPVEGMKRYVEELKQYMKTECGFDPDTDLDAFIKEKREALKKRVTTLTKELKTASAKRCAEILAAEGDINQLSAWYLAIDMEGMEEVQEQLLTITQDRVTPDIESLRGYLAKFIREIKNGLGDALESAIEKVQTPAELRKREEEAREEELRFNEDNIIETLWQAGIVPDNPAKEFISSQEHLFQDLVRTAESQLKGQLERVTTLREYEGAVGDKGEKVASDIRAWYGQFNQESLTTLQKRLAQTKPSTAQENKRSEYWKDQIAYLVSWLDRMEKEVKRQEKGLRAIAETKLREVMKTAPKAMGPVLTEFLARRRPVTRELSASAEAETASLIRAFEERVRSRLVRNPFGKVIAEAEKLMRGLGKRSITDSDREVIFSREIPKWEAVLRHFAKTLGRTDDDLSKMRAAVTAERTDPVRAGEFRYRSIRVGDRVWNNEEHKYEDVGWPLVSEILERLRLTRENEADVAWVLEFLDLLEAAQRMLQAHKAKVEAERQTRGQAAQPAATVERPAGQVNAAEAPPMPQDPAERIEWLRERLSKIAPELEEARKRWAFVDEAVRTEIIKLDNIIRAGRPLSPEQQAVWQRLRPERGLLDRLAELGKEYRGMRDLLGGAYRELETTPEAKQQRYAANAELTTIIWAAENLELKAQLRQYVKQFYGEKIWSEEHKAALRDLIRKVWPTLDFAICSKYTGKRGLDSRAALDLLKLAGVEIPPRNKEYVLPGTRIPGAVHINVGGEEGVYTQLSIMEGLKATLREGGIPAPRAFTPKMRSLFFDHHSAVSAADTSSAQNLYETLAFLGFFEGKDRESIEAAVRLVTREDNKSHPAWRDRDSQWRKGAWQKTILGLAARIPFETMVAYAKDHPGTDFTAELTDDEIARYRLAEHISAVEAKLDQAKREWEALEKYGYVTFDKDVMTQAGKRERQVVSERHLISAKNSKFGNINVLFCDRGGFPGRMDAIKALAPENTIYIMYDRDQKGLFASHASEDLPADLFGEDGMRLRDRMWVYRGKPGERFPFTMRSVLLQLGIDIATIEAHPKFKEAIEAEELTDKARIERALASALQPIEVLVGDNVLNIRDKTWDGAVRRVREVLEQQIGASAFAARLARYIEIEQGAAPADRKQTDEALRDQFLNEEAAKVLSEGVREWRMESIEIDKVREISERYLAPFMHVLREYTADLGIRNVDGAIMRGLGDRLSALLYNEPGAWSDLERGRLPVEFEPDPEYLAAFDRRFGVQLRSFLVNQARVIEEGGAVGEAEEDVDDTLRNIFGPTWPDIEKIAGASYYG